MFGYRQRDEIPMRFREQQYSYMTCRYCFNYHRGQADKCYIMCQYCHSIHFKKDLRKEPFSQNSYICPLIHVHAIEEQTKRAYDCDECGGHGSYEKQTITTFREPEQSFIKRKEGFEKIKEEFGGEGLEEPVRRTYREQKRVDIEQCFQCKGRGKIYRVIDCCENGCHDCGLNRVKLNPKWRKLRLNGQDNDEIFPCRICDQQVNMKEKILKLNCGHTFHRNCILTWLANHDKKCYLCLEKDPFLEIQDLR